MKSIGCIYNKLEYRMIFEGIFYWLRIGILWRDLFIEFGGWNIIYWCFNLWLKKGLLNNLFNELVKLVDYDWVFVDGFIVKVY